MRKAFIAGGAGALIAIVAAILLPGWFGGRPTLQLNVDGQTVVVVPWVGGPNITVCCGRTLDIDTSGAPGQPWLVTVTSSTDHQRADCPLQGHSALRQPAASVATQTLDADKSL